MRLLLVLAFTWCVALPAASAGAEDAAASPVPKIYKWIDENGVAHYTTDPKRVPRSLRRQIGNAPTASEPLEAPQVQRGETQLGAESGFRRDARPTVEESAVEGELDFDAAESRAADLDARIAALERQIADDENTLTALVSGGDVATGEGDAALLRDLGDRLPRLLAELEALRAERDALAP